MACRRRLMVSLCKWQQMALSPSWPPWYLKAWLYSIIPRDFQPLDQFGQCQFAFSSGSPEYWWLNTHITPRSHALFDGLMGTYLLNLPNVVPYFTTWWLFPEPPNLMFLNGYSYPVSSSCLPPTHSPASWPRGSNFVRSIWSFNNQSAYCPPPEPWNAYEYCW